MAIQSKSEIGVILTDILLRLERLTEERPHDAALQSAEKTLVATARILKKGGAPSQKDLSALAAAADTLRGALPDDDEMANHLYDIQDYLALPAA